MANNDWRDYQKKNDDELIHSWGTSPKQKAKEKAYNHEYWEKNKDRILRQRQMALAAENARQEYRQEAKEAGLGPLATAWTTAGKMDRGRRNTYESDAWKTDVGRHFSRRYLGTRDDDEAVLNKKHAAERAAAPAKQGRNDSNLITDSGTHANTPISKMNASVRQNGKDAIDRILKLQKDKVK